MSSCTVQSVAVAAGSVEVLCPKPRLLSLAAAGSFQWRVSHHQEDSDADAGNELLDILLPKSDGSREKDHFFREIAASPPPYFSGSPPSRVSNPLTQDARFWVEKFTPVSSPRAFPIKIRGSFGNKPAVRIEGFECLNGSISAVA